MEAIRAIVNAEQLASIIELPESMRHRDVEIIVLPQADEEKPKMPPSERKSMIGCLKEYADTSLWEKEEGAWERAAVEKYLEKKRDGRT